MKSLEGCIFCKIVNKDIPCEIVYEDDKIIAFEDINKAAPTHIVIIPKKHICCMNEISESDSVILGHLMCRIKDIADMQGIKESGYRLISNCGDHGGQTVKHIHFHLIGGRMLNWPPG